MQIEQNTVEMIGWAASIMAILMYVSYIDQIRLNRSGHPGSVIQPMITVVNCTLWVAYGLLLATKNWPIVVCNIPGIFLGIATAVTAIIAKRKLARHQA